MLESITQKVLHAIEKSPHGISSLDILESLHFCDTFTLKTTLSRLNKRGGITRLKRGIYASKPLRDAFAGAQATFKGYIGFSAALYLHNLITEIPFTVTVVTTNTSASRILGYYEFKAVSLKNKAVGFEIKDGYTVSTRAKTLFDCIYLPKYSIEEKKLVHSFREARVTGREWKEFEGYVKKFINKKARKKFYAIEKTIRR